LFNFYNRLQQFSPYDKGEMICQDFSGTHQFLSPEVVDGTSDYSGAKGMRDYLVQDCRDSL
jgi:hypothetical protein